MGGVRVQRITIPATLSAVGTWDTSTLRRCIVALVVLKVVGLVLVFDFARTTTQPFALPNALYSRPNQWLLVSVGVAAVVTIAYAWAQALGLDPYAWTIDSRRRPFSTLGHPNMYGHFLSVVFAVTLGAVALAEGRWSRAIRVTAGLLAFAV